MNILFISSLYPPTTKGGGELSTHYIALGLAARGNHVKVITTGPSVVESHINGVNVIRAPLPLLDKPLLEHHHSRLAAKQLKEMIGDPTRYDIIHAHDFRSALALAELCLPHTVVTARDYAQISGCTNNILADGSINPGCAEHPWECHRVAEVDFPLNVGRYAQYILNQSHRKMAFASYSRQIFISHAQQEMIQKYNRVANQKTAVIYNPIPPEFFTVPVTHVTTNNVLYVGRVEMYKGVGLLLQAWRKVAADRPEMHLYIVGEGAQQKEYEEQVAKWGLQYRVTFRGKIPAERMRQVYDDCDIVVAPHLWVEPFGRTAVEGMARSKLVIASNVGGPAEIIKHGKTGWLFKRGDAAELSKAITEVQAINHFDKRVIADAARQWVQEYLSADRIAAQYEQFYSV